MFIEDKLNELCAASKKIIELLTTQQQSEKEDTVLDGYEISKKYHISKRTLFNWISSGLVGHKVGSKRYFYQSEIDNFIENYSKNNKKGLSLNSEKDECRKK